MRAKGFELEVTAAPTRGVVMGGSVSYTKSDFRNILPTFLAAQGGSYTPFARPEWTGSVFASYETPPIGGDMTLNLRADALYRSKLAFSGNPIRQVALGVSPQYLSSPGHWRINSRAALKNIQLGGVTAELAVWGRNLANKRYANSTLFLPFSVAANYDPKRTYCMDLTIEF